MNQLFYAVTTMAAGVLACVAYFYVTNRLLDRVFLSKGFTGAQASRNLRRANAIRPWLFMAPAIVALAVYLVYPVFESVRLSFHGRDGRAFVGLDNYLWMVTDGEFRQSIVNNFLWLLVVPALSTVFGLVIAALTDRIWWGNLARTLIFMPMAISFVGAAVIWKFVYDYRSAGNEQIGLLNALVVWLGAAPEAWMTIPFWNNFFLMAILIWIQTGFAMVILSAALRGIPQETVEAAVIDGANGVQIFFRIMVPQIRGAIAVVWTTITILVLKVFDIVLAMTNGQWQTQVLANLMFDWMFRGGGDFGRGAAIAVVIMMLVVPIMIWNIRNATRETEGR
ncbi:sugar ABC transporter permease [Shinella daejeonensis]|uniref:carbohydrate ABC transporter permease n=1 Tax=Shinella daejeonensis TaxID=659017 RepID=UPI0020C7EF5F|nr:sugar ABC transporter permease [Shinella daejeonensis]